MVFGAIPGQEQPGNIQPGSTGLAADPTDDRSTPTFRSAGAGVGSDTSISPAMPAGFAANDILILVCETAATESLSTPSGWSLLYQAFETGNVATGTRLTVFWKRAAGGESSPTISSPGNHVVGRIAAYSGCAIHEDPWDVVSGGVMASAGTSVSITGLTTSIENSLVLNIVCTPTDTSTANQVDGWTNGNLSGITERFDNFTTFGNGGGIGMAEGLKASPGSVANTTVTLTNSAVAAFMMVALKGVPAPESDTMSTASTVNAPTSKVGVHAQGIGV